MRGTFNARAGVAPGDADAAAALRAFHSLDDQLVPLVRSALPPVIPDEPEANWELIDYVEIPAADDLSSS